MTGSESLPPGSHLSKLASFGGRGDVSLGRAWQSKPHPTLPLLATARDKDVFVTSLSNGQETSALTSGHTRSVRSIAWKPRLPPHQLCLASGSFDSTAGIWRMKQGPLETEVSNSGRFTAGGGEDDDEDEKDGPWDLELVLEGHDSEIKSLEFSPSGQYLATCSRDKSVWIWEDVGVNEEDDEWECVAVLNEHDGDVKSVAWCPETNRSGRGRYSNDVLASTSYDNTVRIWREDSDAEWVCVAVLEGHEGTVWGAQWEPKPRGNSFPRLMTWSADTTIRIWTLQEQDEASEAQNAPQHAWGGLGGIPNTMRGSLKEDWVCTATLPRAHTRDIYAATWSAETGMVASTGSDSSIAIYHEYQTPHASENEAAAELDGDVAMTNGNHEDPQNQSAPSSTQWKHVSITYNGHGPYEINHITWCRRYDAECPPKDQGSQEILVTTGDDGRVQPWELKL